MKNMKKMNYFNALYFRMDRILTSEVYNLKYLFLINTQYSRHKLALTKYIYHDKKYSNF
jgi:hypothetical protein